MPVGPGRYRVKTTDSGRKLRLHFRRGSNDVDEVKNLDTGETSRPARTPRQSYFKKRGRPRGQSG